MILASGGMSHTFWPLKQIAKHEASDPVDLFHQWFDRAPKGRNEGDPPEFWSRRHDEYGRD